MLSPILETPLPRRPAWFLTCAMACLVLATTGCSDGTAPGTGSAGGGGTTATAGASAAGATTGGTTSGGAGGSAGSAVAGGGAGGTAAGGTVAGGAAGSLNGGSAGQTATGGTAGGDTVAASFEGLKSVLKASCFGGVCHDLPEHPLQLKIDDKLYGTLTSHMTKGCGVVVKPGSPQDSALVKLLKGPCGGTDRMPLNKCTDDGDEGCVTPANIAAIEQWIAAGAPQ
jgi:hypothetical protein